jgi:miniconductance mechanosensitive channel
LPGPYVVTDALANLYTFLPEYGTIESYGGYMLDFIHRFLSRSLPWQFQSEYLDEFIAFGVLVVLTLVIARVASFIASAIVPRLVSRTKTQWDDRLQDSRFFIRVSRIVPALCLYLLCPVFFPNTEAVSTVIQRLALAYIALAAVHSAAAFLDGVHLIYKSDAAEAAKRKPIKAYVQLGKVLLYIVGVILVITALMNVSPLGILGGLGAMSAVVMLVFKDSILGFVASIQLAGNDMVRIGDWIEMPSYGADGNVTDVTLQSVVVQNWDNTISTIPIYSLISSSFKNWRGMSDGGGRRIKRSIYIDMRSVRFLRQDEIQHLASLPPLTAYMQAKLADITTYNRANNIPDDDYVSGRHLTNLGTYRAYTDAYLKALPIAAKGMTNMVRYLAPDGNGLQMEIYLFSADKKWENYEGIQADIIDHLLAILPEFGLKVFQNPSGSDLALIAERCGK